MQKPVFLAIFEKLRDLAALGSWVVVGIELQLSLQAGHMPPGLPGPGSSLCCLPIPW